MPPSTQLPFITASTFINFRHSNALLALLEGRVIPDSQRPDLAGSRALTLAALERRLYLWPPIFDEEFPPPTEGGLQYDHVTIE